MIEEIIKQALKDDAEEDKNKLNWKPTMELKWFNAVETEEIKKPCGVNGAYYSDVGQSFWQLKQKWISETGEEEWRTIPSC